MKYWYACADYDADDVPFSIVDSRGEPYQNGRVTYEAFSSIRVKESYRALRPDLEFRQTPVAVRRLDTILRDHAPDISKIDVLSIDVEGWELEVLQGLSLDRFRPTVVILENLLHNADYPSYLLRSGYAIWKRSPPNEVYVRTEEFMPISRARLILKTRAVTVAQ